MFSLSRVLGALLIFFLSFFSTTLNDWFRQLVPLISSIKYKIKTKLDYFSRVFPQTCYVCLFDFPGLCVSFDWPSTFFDFGFSALSQVRSMMFKPYWCKLWPISLFPYVIFRSKPLLKRFAIRRDGSVTRVTFLTFTTREILVTALRSCPCKNRPLNFRPKIEFLQVFWVRQLAHMINKNSNNLALSAIFQYFWRRFPRTVQTRENPSVSSQI